MSFFSGKRVLITGVCGTVGSELLSQLVNDYEYGEVIGIDNNESKLFFLEQAFSRGPNLRCLLGDVRDLEKMIRVMRGVDIVFHTAAYKHVVLCERSPFEAVQTNILGVQNVISASSENSVGKVIFTSSDKAVNPTSVMGTSKLMSERLMTAANSNQSKDVSIFASTRFGNVLGSRGSVIPIFHEQIRRGGPVTITSPEMTRFIMSIKEAVRLVIDSAMIACGGEVFVTKMPVIRIRDLAEVMIRELSPVYKKDPEKIRIEVIGSKPGEKMYEELLSQEETRRAYELEKYFAILPAFKALYRNITYDFQGVISKSIESPYNSNSKAPLDASQLTNFLKENALLFEDPSICEHPAERFWPDNSE